MVTKIGRRTNNIANVYDLMLIIVGMQIKLRTIIIFLTKNWLRESLYLFSLRMYVNYVVCKLNE